MFEISDVVTGKTSNQPTKIQKLAKSLGSFDIEIYRHYAVLGANNKDTGQSVQMYKLI